jgi:hypothetical protein
MQVRGLQQLVGRSPRLGTWSFTLVCTDPQAWIGPQARIDPQAGDTNLFFGLAQTGKRSMYALTWGRGCAACEKKSLACTGRPSMRVQTGTERFVPQPSRSWRGPRHDEWCVRAKDARQAHARVKKHTSAHRFAPRPGACARVQVVQVCAEHKKPRKLAKHLAAIRAHSAGLRNAPLTLVFANRVKTVRFLARLLAKDGVRVAVLHSRRSQAEREVRARAAPPAVLDSDSPAHGRPRWTFFCGARVAARQRARRRRVDVSVAATLPATLPAACGASVCERA